MISGFCARDTGGHAKRPPLIIAEVIRTICLRDADQRGLQHRRGTVMVGVPDRFHPGQPGIQPPTVAQHSLVSGKCWGESAVSPLARSVGALFARSHWRVGPFDEPRRVVTQQQRLHDTARGWMGRTEGSGGRSISALPRRIPYAPTHVSSVRTRRKRRPTGLPHHCPAVQFPALSAQE